MKTLITIDNGKITVQVDDGQPATVRTELVKPVTPKFVAKTGIVEASEYSVTGVDLAKDATPAPERIAKPPKKPAVTKPEVKLNCIICGDDISSLRKGRKMCLKPECLKEHTRRYAAEWNAQKRKGTVLPP